MKPVTLKESILSHMSLSPYSQNSEWKNTTFRTALLELTWHHSHHCEVYKTILAASGLILKDETALTDLPFLPVGLFKHLTLVSVPAGSIRRTLTSSGTSRQTVSSIYVDDITSMLQMQALTSIVSDFLGKERLPLLVIDHPSVLQAGAAYSARLAAIAGFSLFGKDRAFALTEAMEPDIAEIIRFLKAVNNKPFFMFGFTYITWHYFLEYLEVHGINLDLSNGILIHGGGWKRLAEHQVTDDVFISRLKDVTGLKKIYNYYGMVEQTGSIYMQCEYRYLHCSRFSEIYIRRAADFSLCSYGEPGIVQTLSSLPYSYPGHNLLTEDEGVLMGEDDCQCGRYGKYFKITRRLVNAELKGCGDVYTN